MYCDTTILTYQIKVLSELVDETLADHVVILVVARVVPVVEQGTKHGASLPPVVRLVQNTRIAAEDMNTFVVNSRILRNELLCDLGGYIFDRVWWEALASDGRCVATKRCTWRLGVED